nr:hypothetical protein [Burkholderia latens]
MSWVAVARVHHVADRECRTVDRLARQRVQLRGCARTVVQFDVALEAPELGRAGRNGSALLRECGPDILGKQVFRQQRLRVKAELDCTALAAAGRRHGDAGHAQQLCAGDIARVVGELLFAGCVAGICSTGAVDAL